jgi:hypothetical protein
MTEQDRGAVPPVLLLAYSKWPPDKTTFRNIPRLVLQLRPRQVAREPSACWPTVRGVLSCGDWKNGFSKEAHELRLGKPG